MKKDNCDNCENYKELADNVIIELENSIANEKRLIEYITALENKLVKTNIKLKNTKEKFDMLDLAFQKLKVLFNNFLINANNINVNNKVKNNKNNNIKVK